MIQWLFPLIFCESDKDSDIMCRVKNSVTGYDLIDVMHEHNTSVYNTLLLFLAYIHTSALHALS